MKITVVGSGYVGLVSGICFAKIGHEVICVDKDQSKIDRLKQGLIPIFEPGLKELLDESILAKKISFTTNLEEALIGSKAVFIAVGTPQGEDGSADMSYVFAVAKEIAEVAKDDKLIVTKSTVPVGTGNEIKKIVKEINSNLNFSIASNPEFLREGAAIDDFMNPDRIVIGVEDEGAKKIMAEIYQKFSHAKIIYCDIVTAELIKYASNSFLATKISFINEMADLCEAVGANVRDLSHAIGLDSRIGNKFLNPGPGFGGSCFPKDIMAIINIASENKVDLSLIDSVIVSNQKRKIKMSQKIAAALNNDVKNKKIALLGLAFKGNTDDIRYSPAITIAKELAKMGANILATDPEAIENSRLELKEFSNIGFATDAYDAIKNSDLIVIVTEWKDYAKLDLQRVTAITKCRKIVDLRNMLEAKAVRAAGFEYFSVGEK